MLPSVISAGVSVAFCCRRVLGINVGVLYGYEDDFVEKLQIR